MLAFLEKIATGFWATIWRVVALITPFFTQARYLKGVGRGLLWVLPITLVAATLVGLWWLNNYPLKLYEYVPSQISALRYFFLPILFGIAYLLCWLGVWLWRLLQPEADLVEFPDVEQAWREGVA